MKRCYTILLFAFIILAYGLRQYELFSCSSECCSKLSLLGMEIGLGEKVFIYELLIAFGITVPLGLFLAKVRGK